MKKQNWIVVMIIGVLIIIAGFKGIDYSVPHIPLYGDEVKDVNDFIDSISSIVLIIGLLIVFMGGRNLFAAIKEDKKKLD